MHIKIGKRQYKTLVLLQEAWSPVPAGLGPLQTPSGGFPRQHAIPCPGAGISNSLLSLKTHPLLFLFGQQVTLPLLSLRDRDRACSSGRKSSIAAPLPKSHLSAAYFRAYASPLSSTIEEGLSHLLWADLHLRPQIHLLPPPPGSHSINRQIQSAIFIQIGFWYCLNELCSFTTTFYRPHLISDSILSSLPSGFSRHSGNPAPRTQSHSAASDTAILSLGPPLEFASGIPLPPSFDFQSPTTLSKSFPS